MGEMGDQGGGGSPFFICQVNHYYKTLPVPAMLEKSNISVFLFMPPGE